MWLFGHNIHQKYSCYDISLSEKNVHLMDKFLNLFSL